MKALGVREWRMVGGIHPDPLDWIEAAIDGRICRLGMARDWLDDRSWRYIGIWEIVRPGEPLLRTRYLPSSLSGPSREVPNRFVEYFRGLDVRTQVTIRRIERELALPEPRRGDAPAHVLPMWWIEYVTSDGFLGLGFSGDADNYVDSIDARERAVFTGYWTARR